MNFFNNLFYSIPVLRSSFTSIGSSKTIIVSTCIIVASFLFGVVVTLDYADMREQQIRQQYINEFKRIQLECIDNRTIIIDQTIMFCTELNDYDKPSRHQPPSKEKPVDEYSV